jgi:hypothetical protein
MYHAAMGAMQGQGPQEIYDRICDLLMDMQKAQWVRRNIIISQMPANGMIRCSKFTHQTNPILAATIGLPSSFIRPFGFLCNWSISTLFPCGINSM